MRLIKRMEADSMRIAQIAPLYERVPPLLYGGTERVVYTLTEELVRRGHDVTLFATADSQTSARLVPMAPTGLRLGGVIDGVAMHLAMLEEVYGQAHEFDLIHSHVDALAFPFARTVATPTVSTMHGRLDLPEHRRVLSRFREQALVSISNSQRDPVNSLQLNWVGTVYNGITLQRLPFRPEPEQPPYLAFVGRICAEKRPEWAIEIAAQTGLPIKIAAKIDPADRNWAETNFLPLLDRPGVEFLGEVGEEDKAELLGGALALLFPIDWPEPFGLVMVEALACGTPVIALDRGSVREILVDGQIGFICRSISEMVSAIDKLGEIDRAACRRRAELLFSPSALADGYERVYQRLAKPAATPEPEKVVTLAAGLLESASAGQVTD